MKKIKRLEILLFVFFLSLSAVSCAKRTDVGTGDEFIYCLNGERTGLVKVSYEFRDGSALDEAEAVLQEMKKPAEDIGYTTVLQKGVEVKKCELVGEVLYLDFSSQYLQMKGIEEKLVRAAVVQSLTRISGINSVWIRVEGADLTDGEGHVLGYLNADDFVQNSGSSPSSYQRETLTLYFANPSGDRLVEQQVDVRYNSNIPKEKFIVERLMKGPVSSGGYPTINPDASLLSVTIKDGICYVNFDKTFLKSTYDIKPEITVYSLVNSIVRGTDASMVQISINGETNVEYMQTVDLTQPLPADYSWVEEGEGK